MYALTYQQRCERATGAPWENAKCIYSVAHDTTPVKSKRAGLEHTANADARKGMGFSQGMQNIAG